MIACDDFVFLHLHKSGGTFVNQLMLKCFPSAVRLGYHLPYAQLPEPYRRLPVLGTVRNPLAYYVSWYHFQRAQSKPNALYRICSDDGTLDFTTTIRNLVSLHASDSRIDRLKAEFPEDFQGHGLNLTKSCIEDLRGSGLGFYSFLYTRLYRGVETPNILKMERLRQELDAYLSPFDTSDRTRFFLSQAPDMNVSEHGPYQQYYDDTLTDLVLSLDGPVFKRHGYGRSPG